MWKRTLIALALLQASHAWAAGPPRQGPAGGKADDEKAAEAEAATPEGAFRTFFFAVIVKDEKTLRAVTLPHDDFEWLLKGASPPEEQREGIKQMVSKMEIRALKPGDEVTLPQGRKMTIGEAEVTDERAVLLPEGAPLPTRCRKVDGRWKVDASAIIAGRKAADAARRKREGR